MIKMKALRSGNFGDGATKVHRGREFAVSTERRATELEEQGDAYRLEHKMAEPVKNKMEPLPSNKAAEAGPLASVGGMTGAELLAPSSHPGLPLPKRRGRPPLNRQKDEFES